MACAKTFRSSDYVFTKTALGLAFEDAFEKFSGKRGNAPLVRSEAVVLPVVRAA